MEILEKKLGNAGIGWITTKCPQCKTEKIMRYEGMQEDENGIVRFKIYSCLDCESTYTDKTLGLE